MKQKLIKIDANKVLGVLLNSNGNVPIYTFYVKEKDLWFQTSYEYTVKDALTNNPFAPFIGFMNSTNRASGLRKLEETIK